MIGASTTTSPTDSPADEPSALARLWAGHSRAFLTLADQGFFSLASFATSFLVIRHLSDDKAHIAYLTLAFNLMIWVAEFHATLVFTPLTILSPKRSGEALRRFHGSTLLQHFWLSILAMIGFAIAGIIERPIDYDWSQTLFALSGGMLAIGLRTYARPYSFTIRKPEAAVLLDASVCVLQVGGVMFFAWYGNLTAAKAIGVIGLASAMPSLVWLFCFRKRFSPSSKQALSDIRMEWPLTRWMFLSGLVWNAGMQLYPWLIAALSGKIEVAVWFACYQLAAVANPLLMGLQNFIGPRIAEAHAERDHASFVKFVYKTAGATAAMLFGPSLLLAIFASPLLVWISKGEFAGHRLTIILLCSAFMLQGITFTMSRGLFALHRADLDLYCNFGPLVLLFTLGGYLTWHYGATGAAASMLVAQIVGSSARAIVFARAAEGAMPEVRGER